MVAVNNSARLLTKTKPKGRHPDKALSASFLRSAPPPKGLPTIRQEVGDRAGWGLKSNMSRQFHMSLRNLDSFNGFPCLSQIEYER